MQRQSHDRKTHYTEQRIIQHKPLARENDGGFGTARNLVEKILVDDHTKDSSEFEFNKKTKDIVLHLRNCHRLDQAA